MQKEKVIVVTPGGSFFRDPHVRAFERRGFDCITFDARSGVVYNPLFRKISRKIPVLGYLKDVKKYFINRKLIRLVSAHSPRYLFVQKAETISPETIDAIKGLGVVTINFYNDLMNEWSVISKIAPHYDYFFNQDHLVLKRLYNELGLRNCFYMAHATEPSPDPFTNRDNKYSVSFIGTYNPKIYPNREKYLLAIKDLGLNIWGSDGWLGTPLKDCFRGRAHGDERFDIYSRSKIVVDINWDFIPAEGLSNRPFEATGCGAMFMTDNVRADIKRAFSEQEVVLFGDENELREKVKYYLDQSSQREKIALAGYQRTVKNHTYDLRIQQIMDTILNPAKYLPA